MFDDERVHRRFDRFQFQPELLSPKRGSELMLFTSICKSLEDQRSVMTLMSRSFPIWPLGIIMVVRKETLDAPGCECLRLATRPRLREHRKPGQSRGFRAQN
jgi:hypothetical protein